LLLGGNARKVTVTLRF
jgi:hypothetical protein